MFGFGKQKTREDSMGKTMAATTMAPTMIAAAENEPVIDPLLPASGYPAWYSFAVNIRADKNYTKPSAYLFLLDTFTRLPQKYQQELMRCADNNFDYRVVFNRNGVRYRQNGGTRSPEHILLHPLKRIFRIADRTEIDSPIARLLLSMRLKSGKGWI